MIRYLMIFSLFVAACHPKQKKPFIIVSKFYMNNNNYCTYYYEDSNRVERQFEDIKDKYNVGDTLK